MTNKDIKNNCIELSGTYQTIEQYAKTHKISKRGARKRAEIKAFPYEIIKFERLILIKIK